MADDHDQHTQADRPSPGDPDALERLMHADGSAWRTWVQPSVERLEARIRAMSASDVHFTEPVPGEARMEASFPRASSPRLVRLPVIPRALRRFERIAVGAAMLLIVALLAALLARMGLRPGGGVPTIPPHTLIYLANEDERVYAIDASTGATVWKSDGLGGFTNTPLYSPTTQLLYVAGYYDSTGTTLYALDPASGKEQWRAKVDAQPSPAFLQLIDGVFYLVVRSFMTHDSTLYALRQSDGKTLWKHAFTGFIFQQPRVTRDRIYVPWNVSDVASANGALIALRTSDGSQLWRTPLTGDPYSSPIVVGDSVILSIDGGWVVALRQETGDVTWRYQPPNYQAGLSSVDTANGLVYVVASRTFYALHADSGTLAWQITVPRLPGRQTSGVCDCDQQYFPAVADGTLYALAGNAPIVYALDPRNGDIHWHYDELGYSPGPAPAISGGIVYLATPGGIVMLSETDGMVLKRYDLRLYSYGVAVVTLPAQSTATAVTVKVPNFVGMQLSDAQTLAQQDHLKVVVKFVMDVSHPRNLVLDQSPAADMSVQKDSEVTLTVSGGDGTVTVPDVVGKEAGDACLALSNVGLTCNIPADGHQYSQTVPLGHVIKTDPNAGTTINLSTTDPTVNIYVSLGASNAHG